MVLLCLCDLFVLFCVFLVGMYFFGGGSFWILLFFVVFVLGLGEGPQGRLRVGLPRGFQGTAQPGGGVFV